MPDTSLLIPINLTGPNRVFHLFHGISHAPTPTKKNILLTSLDRTERKNIVSLPTTRSEFSRGRGSGLQRFIVFIVSKQKSFRQDLRKSDQALTIYSTSWSFIISFIVFIAYVILLIFCSIFFYSAKNIMRRKILDISLYD